MKYCFIVNPCAGKGKCVEELCEKIKSTCDERGVDYDVCIAETIKAQAEYVRSMASNRRDGEEIGFFACGGDGTLCKTMNALMSLEDRQGIYLGLVPVGTGNDFVRNFGDAEVFKNIDAQLDCEKGFVDIIRCNDMFSINMINIGFDCEVVVNTIKFKTGKLVPSKFAYIAGLVKTLVKKPGISMKISVDGGEYEDKKLLLTTFANGEFCGGGFHSNPRAKLNDGEIDSIFVNDITRLKFISLVSYYKNGTHLDNDKFKAIVTPNKFNTVHMIFDNETNISVDGELVKVKELHLSVDKNALGFILPRGANKQGLVELEEKQAASV